MDSGPAQVDQLREKIDYRSQTIFLTQKLSNSFLRHKKRFLIGFVAVCLGIILVGHSYQYAIEPTVYPEKVRVTNITDQSLTISWLTEKPTFGFVFYSRYKWPLAIGGRIPGLLPRLAAWKILPWIKVVPDEHLAFSTTHFVTLNGLSPETAYYYRLSTGLHLYQHRLSTDKERKVILPDIKTVVPLEELTTPDPVYGRVFLSDGRTPASGVIIYLVLLQRNEEKQSFEPQAFLSALTNQNGRWLIDRANARTADFKRPFKLGEGDQQFLEADGGRAGYFDRLIFYGQDKPAPSVKLLGD
jgi:hypothetical protein